MSKVSNKKKSLKPRIIINFGNVHVALQKTSWILPRQKLERWLNANGDFKQFLK